MRYYRGAFFARIYEVRLEGSRERAAQLLRGCGVCERSECVNVLEGMEHTWIRNFGAFDRVVQAMPQKPIRYVVWVHMEERWDNGPDN